MADVKTIKNVDDTTWFEFKNLASENNVNLGVFFKTLIDDYEKNAKSFWKDILEGERILSDKEAEEFEKTVKQHRKEYGFRV